MPCNHIEHRETLLLHVSLLCAYVNVLYLLPANYIDHMETFLLYVLILCAL